MKHVLNIYVAFFTLFSVWMIADTLLEKLSLKDKITSILMDLATVTGALLYVFSIRNDSLVHTWKVISIALVGAHVWLNAYDRFKVLSGKDEEFRD